MNRILPVVLVVGAVVLHFMYCEWEISDSRTFSVPTAAENDRLIFYHHSRIRNVTLFARPSQVKEVATIYGVLVPTLLLVAAGLIRHFQQDHRTTRAPSTSW